MYVPHLRNDASENSKHNIQGILKGTMLVGANY